MIPVGTKSLLFGVHQFIIHPVTVFLAWSELYGLPNWKETVCIIIHDWGYWGSPNMDGPEGEQHPIFGAHLADKYLDKWYLDETLNSFKTFEYTHLCLFHSRHFARTQHTEPSKLCWADKLSIKYDPWWLYLPRAILSGELKEYRKLHGSMGEVPESAPAKEWYDWTAERAIRLGKQQSSEGISFHPQQEDRK